MLSLDGSIRIQLPADNGWFFSRDIDNFELMQFTGLLDKNWKEIYEGDIVKFDPLIKMGNCDGTFAVEIKWNEFGWYPWWGTIPQIQADHGCQIIGNIYENPELLK